MKIILDGKIIDNREALYSELKRQINSEEFIGSNLDALFDVLMSSSSEITIQIINRDILKNSLGNYFDSLLNLFTDLENENKEVEIVYE